MPPGQLTSAAALAGWTLLNDRHQSLFHCPARLEKAGKVGSLAQLGDAQVERTQPRVQRPLPVTVRMMSCVKPCAVSFLLGNVRGALASSQALGAIHSYPVGSTNPGAASTACKQRGNGIQLRGSGIWSQRLSDHASTPDVPGPSPRDDFFGPASDRAGTQPGACRNEALRRVAP